MVAEPLGVIQMLPDLNEGGVEQGTLEIGNALSRAGHRSIVISRGGRLVERLEKEGSRHIAMPYIGEKTPRCLLHLWPLRRLMLDSTINILHLRSRLPAWVGYLAWKSLPMQTRPRLVTTCHGFYSTNAYSAIMAKGEKVIAVSRVIAEHIHEVYRVPSKRIKIIYRGVDPEDYHPGRISPHRIARLKSKWRIGNLESPILLIPARVTRLKGHDLLVRALSRLPHRDWTLICAGDFNPETAFFKQIRQFYTEKGLASQVHFVGHCDDMPAAMRLADIIVSASTRPESFGRTIVEAQALERAVVAPAHGGSLETVDNLRTGWLFKPNDVESLQHILSLALAGVGTANEFGRRGRQRVIERFTLAQMCRATIDLYQGLLRQAPRKNDFA